MGLDWETLGNVFSGRNSKLLKEEAKIFVFSFFGFQDFSFPSLFKDHVDQHTQKVRRKPKGRESPTPPSTTGGGQQPSPGHQDTRKNMPVEPSKGPTEPIRANARGHTLPLRASPWEAPPAFPMPARV